MRLVRARIQNYRSIRDTRWFDVDAAKTILVGPNEAGKTAILRAIEQLNPPDGSGFEALRDYPRSRLNEIHDGSVKPADVVVATGIFDLEPEDKESVSLLDPDFIDCRYVAEKRLDNSFVDGLIGGPRDVVYRDISKDLARLAAYVDRRNVAQPEPDRVSPYDSLKALTESWVDSDPVLGARAFKLAAWLVSVFPLINESASDQSNRYDRLLAVTKLRARQDAVRELLRERLPVFIYFSNIFRVRPRVQLDHLATRVEQGLLDDEEYDFGNVSLLKLVGFTPRQLSDLGKVVAPSPEDAQARKRYQDQLDERSYRLNAASILLTNSVREVWSPDATKGEAARLRITADQQYLKVVVEDDLGVEVELDQRSEGFQWLVSFFSVFFAQTEDRYRNAILLLDEPGLSLHGLKQREFRTTLSRLAKSNQVIYTTHSPFLVGPDELDIARVVELESRQIGTKVHTSVTASDSTAMLPLQEALGYDLAQSLFAHPRNLILESLTDYWYVEATTQLLRESNLAELNAEVALLAAASAGKVLYFATILHAHNLKVAALLDSDAAGEAAATQDTLVHTLGNEAILRTKDALTNPIDKPEIEDLLRDTLAQVAKDLGWDVVAEALGQPNRPIVELLREVPGFSKYHLAKSYVRWTRDHVATNLTENEIAQWTTLVGSINKALD